MSETAEKTDPALWEKVKDEVTAGGKGGKPGQWSARKAQLAVHEYKERGGGYAGERDPDNHLAQWTKEDWGTKSGRESEETGERYLPRAAREVLSDEEYARTSAKKRADTKKGRQHSPQPADVAVKVKPHRDGHARTRAELMAEAKRRQVPGRSRMNKDGLARALAR